MADLSTPADAGSSGIGADVRANIRAELGRRNMSRAELARVMDRSQTHVAAVLRGDGGLTVELLGDIAAALHVSVSVLLGTASSGWPVFLRGAALEGVLAELQAVQDRGGFARLMVQDGGVKVSASAAGLSSVWSLPYGTTDAG
jgi:transcriptional regulator with XRE-family HTH domain